MNAYPSYRTVAGEGTAQIEEKKSIFIAHVRHVMTEEEALNFIQEIKTKHHDATHNVYAYLVDDRIMRQSDDKEPSGTAGVPVLEVLKKEKLEKVAVVVTRYFGGTLLGAGGLIRAYSKSAKAGVDAAGIVTMKPFVSLGVTVPYPLLGKVERELLNRELPIEDKEFTDRVKLTVLCEASEVESLKEALTAWTNAQAEAETLGSAYAAVDDFGKLVRGRV